MIPNMIGAYGEWAAQTMQDPPRLSFRQPMFSNVQAWRPVARARYRELLLGPGGAAKHVPVVQHQMEFEGLSIEHLHWKLPYGPTSEGLILDLVGVSRVLRGVVGMSYTYVYNSLRSMKI